MVKLGITRRPYREGDEKGINDLFNKVFCKQRSLEEWNWKFRDNPAVTDLSQWILVLEKEDVIVGHYASMPVDILCGSKSVKACQPVDTMIDPSAKVGIKMLRDLLKESVERAEKHSHFGFGFPNEIAYKVGKRMLGYQDLGSMEQLYRRLSLRGAVKRRLPAMPLSLLWPVHKLSHLFYSASLSTGSYTIEEASEFGTSVNHLWSELKGEFQIAVIRDSTYLNWRYKGRGYTILIARDGAEVVGYVILKMNDSGEYKVGSIIDILAKKDAATSVIKSALKFFIGKGADYCLCAMVAGSSMAGYMREAGFEEDKGFESFPVVYISWTPEKDNDFLMNFNNWHLTFGDTDGY